MERGGRVDLVDAAFLRLGRGAAGQHFQHGAHALAQRFQVIAALEDQGEPVAQAAT